MVHSVNCLKDMTELAAARSERRLPTNLSDLGIPSLITKEQEESTALAYLLTDVVYQIMFDMCEVMQRQGSDLRHETKRRFNEFFRSASDFMNKSVRVSRDISLLSNTDVAIDSFTSDSDWLKDVVCCIFHKYVASPDASFKDKVMSMVQKL